MFRTLFKAVIVVLHVFLYFTPVVIPAAFHCGSPADISYFRIESGHYGEKEGYLPQGIVSVPEHCADIRLDGLYQHQKRHYYHDKDGQIDKVFYGSDEISHATTVLHFCKYTLF